MRAFSGMSKRLVYYFNNRGKEYKKNCALFGFVLNYFMLVMQQKLLLHFYRIYRFFSVNIIKGGKGTKQGFPKM